LGKRLGSALRRQDHAAAAIRAVRDAHWHNSINIVELFGHDRSNLQITVVIGVQEPGALDTTRIVAVFPQWQVTIVPWAGGHAAPSRDGGKPTVIANVAVPVPLDLEVAR